MNSLNEATLIGRLGKTPEVKYTQSGTAYTKISVCTNKRTKKGDKYESQPVWHNIAIWGKSAENAAHVLSKGDLVMFRGELSYSQWENRDGQTKDVTEILIADWKLMAKNGNSQTGQEGNYPDIPQGECPF